MKIIPDEEFCPQLRSALEPVHFRDQQGEKYFGLLDPFELCSEQIAMPRDLFFTLQFMDGRHSLKFIQSKYQKKFGLPLSFNRLVQLVEKLDSVFLCDNENFSRQFTRLQTQFKAETVRNMQFAGSAYPDNSAAFHEFWQNYPVQISHSESGNKSALVAPHIDIQLGAETFAKCYAHVPFADLYIILGISHQPMQNPFALTIKDFQTPNGVLKSDKEFVNRLAEKLETDYFADEIYHKFEHSIEFQTSCLHSFVPQPFQIVPILCSFDDKMDLAAIEKFTGALLTLIEQSTQRICIIAGVDFSHVGPRYGDHLSPDPYFLSKVEEMDRQVIDILKSGDADGLLQFFRKTGNPYHICGFAALYTLLKIFPGQHGQLLHYNNAIMDSERSTVTFAGMLFS